MTPQGVYAADSVFKLFGLWAAEEIYGWLWVTLVPLAIVAGLIWSIWRGIRLGRGVTDGFIHFLYILLALFLLWPVPAQLGSPLFSPIPEDDQALEHAKTELLDQKQRTFEGIPRIQLWLMALADTVLGQATVRVASLNSRPLADEDFLRLRANHAMPLSVPLARRSAVYWALCYEPAVALHAATNGAQRDPPGPFSADLDPYLPAHGDKEWSDLLGLLDERTQTDLGASVGCPALRDALRDEYLNDELIRDPHVYLMRDLGQAGVPITPEEYAEHLVRQSLSPNAAYVTRLRSVWSDDSELAHAPVVPHYREPEGMLQELANAVGEPINAVYNWWTDRTAAVGTRVELPSAAKKSYETFRLLAPSFFGVTMCFVILLFPFLAVPIAFGFYKPIGTYLKIYVSIAAWPLLWTIIGSYQLFMTQRSWGSLGDFMGDAGGYGNVAIPFLLAGTPVLSIWLVSAAFGAAQGGLAHLGGKGGGGGGAGGIERRMEGAVAGASIGAVQRGAEDAAKGAKLGAKVGGGAAGPVGAGLGAVVGGIAGVGVGAARGAVEGGIRGGLDPGHAFSPGSRPRGSPGTAGSPPPPTPEPALQGRAPARQARDEPAVPTATSPSRPAPGADHARPHAHGAALPPTGAQPQRAVEATEDVRTQPRAAPIARDSVATSRAAVPGLLETQPAGDQPISGPHGSPADVAPTDASPGTGRAGSPATSDGLPPSPDRAEPAR